VLDLLHHLQEHIELRIEFEVTEPSFVQIRQCESLLRALVWVNAEVIFPLHVGVSTVQGLSLGWQVMIHDHAS